MDYHDFIVAQHYISVNFSDNTSIIFNRYSIKIAFLQTKYLTKLPTSTRMSCYRRTDGNGT